MGDANLMESLPARFGITGITEVGGLDPDDMEKLLCGRLAPPYDFRGRDFHVATSGNSMVAQHL